MDEDLDLDDDSDDEPEESEPEEVSPLSVDPLDIADDTVQAKAPAKRGRKKKLFMQKLIKEMLVHYCLMLLERVH